MSASMLVAAVAVVLCLSAAAADFVGQKTPSSISGSFQAAFDKDVVFWTGLPYTTMPKPARPATDTEGEYVVLLRVFIDLYMNKLRLEQRSSPMADFVASLPDVGDCGRKLRVQSPSLLELFGSMLQPNEPTSPPSLYPLEAASVVLGVFGSMIRAALYSSDDLQAWRAASFVGKYVQVMVSCKMPFRVALAVLARDLVLADENVQTEAQVKEAAAALQRFVVVLDQKPTLSDALDLLSGLSGSKFEFDCLDEIPPHIHLDLLVTGLRRGHVALRTTCLSRAGRFRQDVGVRMVVILEQVLFLLAAADRVDVISTVVLWVRRRTVHRLGLLPYLALFWDRNRALLEEVAALKLVPFKTWDVLYKLMEETFDNFKNTTWWLQTREKAPVLVLVDTVRRLASDRLPGVVQWPRDWPPVNP